MAETIKVWLDQFSPQAQAAIIAAIVGLIAGLVGPLGKHYMDRWSLRHRLRVEHEYSERKKLRELISCFHGRVLESAESVNHRLWNLQENQNKGWLRLNGQYQTVGGNYYFRTTIHRLIVLLIYLQHFQNEAIFIDARIAESTDLSFLKYAKALEWTLADVALFKGLPYDPNYETDHVFKGHIRVACEVCTKDNKPLSLGVFENCLRAGQFLQEMTPLYEFFDDMSADGRLRWDRLVVFHLLLCAFINTFGYPMQRTSIQQLRRIAGTVRHPEVLQNLLLWLDKLGIDTDHGGTSLRNILRHH